jgi:hypothetical protein
MLDRKALNHRAVLGQAVLGFRPGAGAPAAVAR